MISIQSIHFIMSTTTIKVDTRLKARFDRLQATMRVLTGRKVTQSELLDRLLERGESSPESLAGNAWRPLKPDEIERVMALPVDLGFELGDVDEVLYGKKKKAQR